MTKEEIYALLTAEGVDRTYSVIPEFYLPLNGQEPRIDLVWATPRVRGGQNAANAEYWVIAAAFEIEGCNVQSPRMKQHRVRAGYLKELFPQAQYNVVLYNTAYGRTDADWNEQIEGTVEDWLCRQRKFEGPMNVLDGRKADWLGTLPGHLRPTHDGTTRG